MNDPHTYGYQDNSGGAALGPRRGPMGGPNPMAQYKFSPDEMRVLQECNTESFYQRSLPLSTVFGLGTFAAVQGGYLKPNLRFGAFPKVSLAVMVGYFLGKLSYQQACADKLMALPGSYIGQLLRDRRDGNNEGTTPMVPASGSMLGARPEDIYSDAGLGSALEFDVDRPNAFHEDLQDYRPNDNSSLSGPAEPAPPPPRSYDDIRRQNRGDFAGLKQDPYRVDPGLGAPPPMPRRAPPRGPPPPTNQYGDALD